MFSILNERSSFIGVCVSACVHTRVYVFCAFAFFFACVCVGAAILISHITCCYKTSSIILHFVAYATAKVWLYISQS